VNISEPGVVSVCPVSTHVLRPDKIIGHPPRAELIKEKDAGFSRSTRT
jgi:hypothetical protein